MRENLEVTMKMVKSLLLGSAAGLVAVAGAQAADLPVKAKPVEYVKVCSAYGAGFYYIPGTDICLRVGGYVWSEFEVNDFGAGAGNFATGAIGGDFVRNRADDWTSIPRTRFDLIFDARTNTEYGTLRSYASVGWQWTTNLDGFQQQQLPASTGNYAWYYDRAFIQFAGLTFGYVGSFFDFDPSLILSQQTSKSFKFTPAIAYTAQLGNGISASMSMEDSTTRRTHIQYTRVAMVTAGLYDRLLRLRRPPSARLRSAPNNFIVALPIGIYQLRLGHELLFRPVYAGLRRQFARRPGLG